MLKNQGTLLMNLSRAMIILSTKQLEIILKMSGHNIALEVDNLLEMEMVLYHLKKKYKEKGEDKAGSGLKVNKAKLVM